MSPLCEAMYDLLAEWPTTAERQAASGSRLKKKKKQMHRARIQKQGVRAGPRRRAAKAAAAAKPPNRFRDE